jgi:hypothetical protein
MAGEKSGEKGGWRVVRQDDNGNQFIEGDGLSEEFAKQHADERQKQIGGHKQIVWAEPQPRP